MAVNFKDANQRHFIDAESLYNTQCWANADHESICLICIKLVLAWVEEGVKPVNLNARQ